MFPLHVEKKLQMFQKEKYAVLNENEQKELEEKSESGRVKLTFTVLGETLILLSPEHNVLPWLDGKQKGGNILCRYFCVQMGGKQGSMGFACN
ncbi:hypothetical protein C805_00533 [Eubacterium sp. 14-2]|uniref:hypothetical protein n=1 Tax=Eubacterium sp. 14-2 TaxID=1235790 RepID=UPI000338FF8A|nr:hypothetical protein [Eubacterium sp. 14-2]EOT28391.1 hypothetical protein C805_00533 [Eubacterium sp. 14-2]